MLPDPVDPATPSRKPVRPGGVTPTIDEENQEKEDGNPASDTDRTTIEASFWDNDDDSLSPSSSPSAADDDEDEDNDDKPKLDEAGRPLGPSVALGPQIWSTALPNLPSATKAPSDKILNKITSTLTGADKPLILYAIYDTPFARENLAFFLRHGLHSNAKFIVIINGKSTIDRDILAPYLAHPDLDLSFVKRTNTCFDLGAYAKVLLAHDAKLFKAHKRFIMLNASIRGPFIPAWSRDCWSEAYLRAIDEKVKLVGMTVNCSPTRHVQSMILATDRIGMEILLTPEVSILSPHHCPPVSFPH